MSKIVVIGANGQLGADLVVILSHTDLVPLTHADIELCDHVATRRVLQKLRPDVVINTAAFNRVDESEDDAERAFGTNTLAVRNLAGLSHELGYVLAHISTDYVFGGEKRTPYEEDDRPDPLNVYGISKLAGEYLVRNLSKRHFVIRTSGLYGTAGAHGKAENFVNTMLRLAREDRPIRVVNDQTFSPTFTGDLARAVKSLVLDGGEYGLYHVTNSGECTWYGFAAKIFDLVGLRPDVAPTSSQEFGAKAVRPAYSVLGHGRFLNAGFEEPRPWAVALAEYLGKGGIHR
jgi:dTDP-4-dehydrorhamnose reductase